MRWLIFLAFIVLSFVDGRAKADPLVLTTQIKKFELNGQLTYLRDPGASLTLDDVSSHHFKHAFTKNDEGLNFGITTDVIWLRFEIQRASSASTEWWLEVAPPYIGEVTLYQLQTDGKRIGNPGRSAGIMFPLSTRDFKVRHSTFKLNLQSTEPQVFFVRLRSNTQLNVRGYLWHPVFYAEKSASEHLILGVYYGAFALIICIGGLRWWMDRNPRDFWWLVYLIAEALVMFRMNGFASQYIFPEFPILNTVTGTLAFGFMILAGSHFGIHGFALNKNDCPYSYHAARAVGILALIFSLTRLINLEPASSICLLSISFLLCLLNCAFSYRFLGSGEPSARFYFSAIWFMTACAILVLFRNFGFIPAYQFIDYVWQSNLIIHASLISFGIVLTQRETTSERRRATDYRTSAELSQKSTTLQKRMMALVSHEFRNSLAILNVSMHIMGKRRDLPLDVIERHKNIVHIHHQMRKIIDNFLLEERIQNANIKVIHECTDVADLIRNVIFLAELHGKGQVISANLHGLPRYLWLDKAILQLVLGNLLDNAIKYSAPGSQIRVSGRSFNGFLEMSVSDIGIGMDGDSLSRLFEPHFKADRQTEGIGIGLYMVRLMVHAHDGDMRVASKIGSGSTMAFWIKVGSGNNLLAKQAPEREVSH